MNSRQNAFSLFQDRTVAIAAETILTNSQITDYLDQPVFSIPSIKYPDQSPKYAGLSRPVGCLLLLVTFPIS